MLQYLPAGRQLPWSERHYRYPVASEPLRFSLEASVPIALLMGITMVGLDWARDKARKDSGGFMQ